MSNASQQGTDPQTMDGRWLTVSRTLCFVTYQRDVLLMKRSATRRIFPGRYNGLGGHVERGEEPLTCAQREIREESGIALPLGVLRLHGVSLIDAGQTSGITLFIFTAALDSLPAVLHEGAEGSLHWVAIDRALDLPLVDDLPILWPRLFPQGRPYPAAEPLLQFFAHVSYDVADQMQMRFAGEGQP